MLSNTERLILHGIAADSTHLRLLAKRWKQDPRSRPDARDPAGNRQIVAVETFPALGVRVDLPRWLGTGESTTVYRAAQRSLAKLARTGLVRRSAAWGGRLTHALLTGKGMKALSGLRSDQVGNHDMQLRVGYVQRRTEGTHVEAAHYRI